ncbi:MAG: hypothetical protein IJW82_03985 [Clostridia bacterium]|nr:hypothetical protein [Clostridia bacterium]
MTKRIVKNKKGVSIAMISQAMMIISSMFIIMSVFVVLNALTNKSKDNSTEVKIYCQQLSEDFISLNNQVLKEAIESSEINSWSEKDIIDNTLDNFLTNYVGSSSKYSYKTGYPLVVKDPSNDTRTIQTVYAMFINDTELKYEMTIVADYDTNNISLTMKKSNSTINYFTCELGFEDVDTLKANGEYSLISWNLRI